MKTYEIWIGSYHLGMGFDPSKESELLATVEASSFKIACFKWELMNKLYWINKAEAKGDYISDQDLEWFYNPRLNSNGWQGKYYETKAEADASFNYERNPKPNLRPRTNSARPEKG